MKVNERITNKYTYKDFYTSNKDLDLQSPKAFDNEKSKNVHMSVAATTLAGTLIPIFIIRNDQGKSLKRGALQGLNFETKIKTIFKSFNIEYTLKEMLFTSVGSIIGGLSGGLLFDKNAKKKSKIKESIFQLSNIAIPTSIVAWLLNLSNKSTNFKGILPKAASVIVGIGAGMPVAAAVSNKINNTVIDKENPHKRKLALKDCFVHIDDLVGALALAKIPFMDKFQIDKILPVLYGICGYEAGIKK